MMKRAFNKLAWPYTGIVFYDKMDHMCVSLEGLVCGEQYDTYLVKVNFLLTCITKRSLSDVKIVMGGGCFDQSMVKNLGFTNALFFADRWHTTDSSLCRTFDQYVTPC